MVSVNLEMGFEQRARIVGIIILALALRIYVGSTTKKKIPISLFYENLKHVHIKKKDTGIHN